MQSIVHWIAASKYHKEYIYSLNEARGFHSLVEAQGSHILVSKQLSPLVRRITKAMWACAMGVPTFTKAMCCAQVQMLFHTAGAPLVTLGEVEGGRRVTKKSINQSVSQHWPFKFGSHVSHVITRCSLQLLSDSGCVSRSCRGYHCCPTTSSAWQRYSQNCFAFCSARGVPTVFSVLPCSHLLDNRAPQVC